VSTANRADRRFFFGFFPVACRLTGGPLPCLRPTAQSVSALYRPPATPQPTPKTIIFCTATQTLTNYLQTTYKHNPAAPTGLHSWFSQKILRSNLPPALPLSRWTTDFSIGASRLSARRFTRLGGHRESVLRSTITCQNTPIFGPAVTPKSERKTVRVRICRKRLALVPFLCASAISSAHSGPALATGVRSCIPASDTGTLPT
jgi:hypothetical protein